MNIIQKINICALLWLSVLSAKAQTTYEEMEQLIDHVVIMSKDGVLMDKSMEEIAEEYVFEYRLMGDSSCTCWGCDITYDYIRINGDYRS